MAHDPISESVLALLKQQDPAIADLIGKEANRQATTIELIASENHVSQAVMHAMGTCLTNKYAEGYPGARYYGGGGGSGPGETTPPARAQSKVWCAGARG